MHQPVDNSHIKAFMSGNTFVIADTSGYDMWVRTQTPVNLRDMR